MSQGSLFGTPGGGAAVANIDGGSRGNPGPAAYGVRIERDDGSVVELKEAFGVATNNVAEYRGLLAALTWATGMALLVVVYYMGGLLQEPAAELSQGAAIAIGLALLPVAWIVYDTLWRFVPTPVAAPVSFALIVAAAWALGQVFSARAAYMHVGAALGTIMAANVWERILPAQRAMVEAIRAGRPPDLTLGARAKERSKHNTFIVVPLVMIMLSSHFPTLTFAHDQAWAMLGLLTLVGWAAAWLVRKH